ncbi:MAG: aspartyl-phosphate phosphatase Spo0E family protein [Sporomusaceae bacterium]|nr:aspartyl-phosphate phosphatase Spo0E family protein [Sporomusaceae bacterium]
MEQLRELEVEIERLRRELHVLVQSERSLALSCEEVTQMSHLLDQIIVEYEKRKTRQRAQFCQKDGGIL